MQVIAADDGMQDRYGEGGGKGRAWVWLHIYSYRYTTQRATGSCVQTKKLTAAVISWDDGRGGWGGGCEKYEYR